MSEVQTYEIDGVTYALIDGNMVPMQTGNASAEKPKAAKASKAKDIPTATVKVGDARVAFDQRYGWGNAERGGDFKSHGGFRIHVNVLDSDGSTAKGAKPVNLTADAFNAIRAMSEKDAAALVRNAVA